MTKRVDTDRSPIFIIGSGRSGTTLLRQILNSHPRIHLTNEAGFYLGSQFVPARANGSDWLECYFRSYFFAGLNIDPQTIRNDLTQRLGYPVAREHIVDAYRAIMRCAAKRFNKPRYGDKTPLHALYLDRIFADFPEACVIHIMRDPRATIRSLSKMPWTSASFCLNTWYYRGQLFAIEKYRHRILEIRLEDLTTQTEKTANQVLEFAGERWDDAVLDHSQHAPVSDLRLYPWLKGVTRPVEQASTQWQGELDPFWVWLIERMTRRVIENYGYEFCCKACPKLTIATAAMVATDFAQAMGGGWRFMRLIRHMAGRYPAPPKKVEELMMAINAKAKITHSSSLSE